MGWEQRLKEATVQHAEVAPETAILPRAGVVLDDQEAATAQVLACLEGSTYAVFGDCTCHSFVELVRDDECPGLLCAEVKLQKPRGNFQVVCDRNEKCAFYPGGANAARKSQVYGPDADGQGKDWCLNGQAGDVFRIDFLFLFQDGRVMRRVDWQRVDHEVRLPLDVLGRPQAVGWNHVDEAMRLRARQAMETLQPKQLVSVSTTVEGHEAWLLQLELPWGTKVRDLRALLRSPPHSLRITPEMRLLLSSKMWPGLNGREMPGDLVEPRDDDAVADRMVLLGYVPEALQFRVMGNTVFTRKGALDGNIQGMGRLLERAGHPIELAGMWREAMGEADEMEVGGSMLEARAARDEPILCNAAAMGRDHWEGLSVLCEGLSVHHAEKRPRDKRASSWSRTIAFAQVELGIHGVPMRQGTLDRPFVVWVLGATDAVEVHLAEQGFFKDANFVERAPTEVVLIGSELREVGTNDAATGLHTADGEGAAEAPGGRGAPARSGSVTKGGSATYSVVHRAVHVRAHPSPDANIVGRLHRDEIVRGREEGIWLRLDSASAKLCGIKGPECAAWVMIDGSALGLGALLVRRPLPRQGTAAGPNAQQGPEAAEGPGAQEGALPATVRTASYEEVLGVAEASRPDLVMLFMPEPPRHGIPHRVLELVDEVPAVISTRFALQSESAAALRRELGPRLLLQQTRCPFSANAPDPSNRYDDNGWLLAVRGRGALAAALALRAESEVQAPAPAGKIPVVFWGIVDLKFDPAQPVLDRVKVLETGDGRISKFSGDGAAILRRAQERYEVEEGVELLSYNFVSKDKRLTHDLMESYGYGHLLPRQACFPRKFESDLAERICDELSLDPCGTDDVVLKLCNRSRAAGVIVVPVDELEDVLEDVLVPPEDIEGWFRPRLAGIAANGAADLGLDGHFEEQQRHWWSNEGPSFVVEKRCYSMHTERGGKHYDGTMRVAFVLRRKQGVREPVPPAVAAQVGTGAPPPLWPTPELVPEDLDVEWLGGYWKLPKGDVGSNDLRERVVSAARASGTAPVRADHLAEVYAALGDSLQYLFGGAAPEAAALAEWYQDQPELAAYLTARKAMTQPDPAEAKKLLNLAGRPLAKARQGPGRNAVKSYIERALGVLDARNGDVPAEERWEAAKQNFQSSVDWMPTNASSLYLLGRSCLELGELEKAVDFMNKSMLLDPDFKAPYIYLGVAYVRQKEWQRAIDVSEECLRRHPGVPQCQYHIGVACCFQALSLEEAEEARGTRLDPEEEEEHEALRERACSYLCEARASEEAQRRRNVKVRVPWLKVDDQMVEVMAPEARRTCGVSRKVQQPVSGWGVPGWRL